MNLNICKKEQGFQQQFEKLLDTVFETSAWKNEKLQK